MSQKKTGDKIPGKNGKKKSLGKDHGKNAPEKIPGKNPDKKLGNKAR